MIELKPEDLHVSLYNTERKGSWDTSHYERGVTVIYLPTGTKVSVERHRSQHKNKHEAITILQDLVTPIELGDRVFTHLGENTIIEVIGGGMYRIEDGINLVVENLIAHTEIGYNYKTCLSIRKYLKQREDEFHEYQERTLKRIQDLGGY